MSLTEFNYTILDEIPMPIIIVDSDVRGKFLNSEAKRLVTEGTEIYNKRGGDILNCVHSTEHENGCGHGRACNGCVIRNSVKEASEGNKTYKVPTILKLNGHDDEPVLFHAAISTSPFSDPSSQLFMIVVENVSELMQLRKIIPVCTSCQKIKNDDDYLMAVEDYLSQLTNVDYTYSVCDDCADKIFATKCHDHDHTTTSTGFEVSMDDAKNLLSD